MKSTVGTSKPAVRDQAVDPAGDEAHRMSAEEALRDHRVGLATGLTAAEAGERRATHGVNTLADAPRRPAVFRFLDQLRSVLILVLIGAAVLAGIVGDFKDTIVITAVLVINATIGFIQEERAERSLEALRTMLTPSARVRRDGQEQVVDASTLVPGDVVLLEAGDRVPADGRLVVAAGVEVDESTLTGESQPVAKSLDAIADVPLAERTCMVHMNTALTRGRAEMLVTATGMQTAVGRIAGMLAEGKEPPTPLQRQLDTLGKRLAVLGLAAVSIYVALALLRGDALGDVALRAVALAVATVPEGLPAVLALTLALGDPTEGALLVLAAKVGGDTDSIRAARPRTGEVPFDAAHKYMATFHAETGDTRVYVKGAADVLLARCTRIHSQDGVVPLQEAGLADLHAMIGDLGARGLRVLAVAEARRPGDAPRQGGDLHRHVLDLDLLALVAIADPPRPEARDAVALCRRAGIAVKMITGDHAATASAIARELGIDGRVVTGAELERMTPELLADEIDDIGAFARVTPEHKVAIVQALQQGGHVVAMTGDGVNDAAALKNAHIGVAMGITGTEVAKEAGTIILTDDNFATIVGAVEEGRGIYDNVVKFVRFQLSTNAGAILTFLTASVTGLAAPLTAIQILWVNIIMDGPPAMALGVDPARRGIMEDAPRRPDAQILSRSTVGRLLRVGAVMAAGTLGMLVAGQAMYSTPVALTMAFTTFVLFQIVNVFNARTGRESVFSRHLFRNRWLWLSVGVVLVLQVAVVHTPWLQPIFSTVSLSAAQWCLCVATALTILVVEEIVKAAGRRRRP